MRVSEQLASAQQSSRQSLQSRLSAKTVEEVAERIEPLAQALVSLSDELRKERAQTARALQALQAQVQELKTAAASTNAHANLTMQSARDDLKKVATAMLQQSKAAHGQAQEGLERLVWVVVGSVSLGVLLTASVIWLLLRRMP